MNLDKLQEALKKGGGGLQQLVQLKAEDETLSLDLGKEVAPFRRAGWLLMLAFFSIGIVWGVFAPLEGAAVASGKVIVSTNRKKVQHLEGGIIAAIHVKEGQEVKKDAPLVDLMDTQAKSRHLALEGNLLARYAQVTRLIAERDNKAELTFDWPKVNEESAAAIEDLTKQQVEIIAYRRNEVNLQRRTLMQQIQQLKTQVEGLQKQQASVQEQLKLVQDRIQIADKLKRDRLFSQDQYLTLQMQETEQKSQFDQIGTQIRNAQEEIHSKEIEYENVVNLYQKTVVEELQQASAELQTLLEQRKELGDVLGRTAIKAPISGLVKGLTVSNIGQVIGPGEVLMEIVPQDDNLIVEARVKPQDIDNVHIHQKAKVILVPYRTRYMPTIMGEVESVSADTFFDQVTGETYYAARLTISKEYLKHIDRDVQLYPGMPTEVFLVTQSRSMFSYLFDPVRQSFRRAFREE